MSLSTWSNWDLMCLWHLEFRSSSPGTRSESISFELISQILLSRRLKFLWIHCQWSFLPLTDKLRQTLRDLRNESQGFNGRKRGLSNGISLLVYRLKGVRFGNVRLSWKLNLASPLRKGNTQISIINTPMYIINSMQFLSQFQRHFLSSTPELHFSFNSVSNRTNSME